MASAASFQRAFISAPTSYLPAVRRAFDFPPRADAEVQRWRRMGASWQAIANNFGCSVHEVRKAWDPDYVPVHSPAQPIVAPKPPSGPPPGCVYRNTYQFDILAGLEAEALSRTDIGRRVPVRPQDVHRLIGLLKDKSLIAERRPNFFEITAVGRAELQWHRERAATGGDDQAAEARRRVAARRGDRPLRILAAMADGPMTSLELSERCRLTYDQTRDFLAALRAQGEVELLRGKRDRAYLWALTGQGRTSAEAAGHE